jgi:O-antigen/teichoic acid export membrane protein
VTQPPQTAQDADAAFDAVLQQQPDVSGRTVGRALSWAGLGQVISRIVLFSSVFVLAAFLPPAAFGTVTAAAVITSTAALLVGTGTRGSIITNERLTTDHLRYALAVNVTVGIVVSVSVIALADPLVALLLPGSDPAVLRWLMVAVALHAFSVVPMAVLQKNLNFKAETTIVLVSSFTTAAAAIVAAALGAGVWALVLRAVAGAVIQVTLAWIVARRYLPAIRMLIGRGHRPKEGRGASAKWFFLVALLSLIAMSVDYVVIGRLTGATELGLYSIAFAMGFAPLTHLSWWLGGVLLPAAAATQDLDVVAHRTLRAVRVLALGLGLLVVPALLLAPWLVPLALGDQWVGSVIVFQILFPIGIAHAVLNMVAESLGGSGNVKVHVQMLGLWAVAIVPLLLVLVPADGIRGAAIAHLVVLVPVAAGYLLVGARRLGLPRFAFVRGLAGVAPPLLAQAAVSLALFWTMTEAGAPDSVSRIVGVAAGIAAAAGAILVRPNGPFLEARGIVAAARGAA